MRRGLPDLLTLAEVAEFLKLSDRTVYTMCRRGRLPGVCKVGGQWRIDRRKLLAWLDAGGELEPAGGTMIRLEDLQTGTRVVPLASA